MKAPLLGLAAFPVAPPVTKAALDAARTAIAAAKQGEVQATADKVDQLINALVRP